MHAEKGLMFDTAFDGPTMHFIGNRGIKCIEIVAGHLQKGIK